MRRLSEKRSVNGGFTLLEVVAALVIAATALVYLIRSETDGIRGFNRTRDLRHATILGTGKLQELLGGMESEASGEFQERPGWRWEARREPFANGFGTEMVTLTVHYTTMGRTETFTLEQIAP